MSSDKNTEVEAPAEPAQAEQVALTPEDADKEAKLTSLRAQLEVAHKAASDLPEDAPDEHKDAAQKVKEDAERALAQAHIDQVKAEEERARETRVAEHQLSYQEFIQAGTVQNVRGTDALTPEEHALRRNPERN